MKKNILHGVILIAIVIIGIFIYMNFFKSENPMSKYNLSDYYTGDALMVAQAIRDGDQGELSTILKQSPEVASNRGSKDFPLLALAMGYNNPKLFDLLLKEGANPNDYILVEGVKMSLLSVAIGAKDSHFFNSLLTYKVDPNGLPETEPPLFTAKFSHKPDRFDQLIQAGADINRTDRAGKTVLMVVVGIGNYVDALKLVTQGADVNIQMKNGNTIRKMIERYPLPANTEEGKAQAELFKMVK